MAATVQIHEMSAITTGVDRTAGNGPIVFRANDGNEQTSANPIQIPVACTDYSFTKQMRANVTVAPATQIENLVCYSDGTNNFGTGIGVEYDINATFQAQIDTTITGADYFGLNSGAPGDLDAGPHVGTGYKGDLLRLQMTVASTAAPGQTPVDEALTFAYDES
jgi:hypothetical protein